MGVGSGALLALFIVGRWLLSENLLIKTRALRFNHRLFNRTSIDRLHAPAEHRKHVGTIICILERRPLHAASVRAPGPVCDPRLILIDIPIGLLDHRFRGINADLPRRIRLRHPTFRRPGLWRTEVRIGIERKRDRLLLRFLAIAPTIAEVGARPPPILASAINEIALLNVIDETCRQLAFGFHLFG